MLGLTRKIFLKYPFHPWLKSERRAYALGLVALFFVDAINVGLPLIVKYAVDAVVASEMRTVIWAGGAYFVLMVAQAWGRYLWRIYLIGSSHRVAASCRKRFYGHLQKLPLDYYQRVRAGDLMSRATNDVEAIRTAVGPGVLVAVDAVFIFALMLPAMFWLSWKLALLALAFYPLVPVLTRLLGDKIDALFEVLQKKMSVLSAFTQESFSGIRLIKSLCLEPRTEGRFLLLSEDYLKDSSRLAIMQSIFSPALGLITQLGTFLILVVGGLDVIGAAISIGTFIAFQRFVVQLSWPMEAIGWAVTMHKEGVAALRRVDEILSVPEVKTVQTPQMSLSVARDLDKPLLQIHPFSFSYPGASAEALELGSISVNAGQKVAIVGPVGSGKSTLLNLLTRLYEPPAGSIFLGGNDITAIQLSDLRRRVVTVEQAVHVFSESVYDNVILGAEDLQSVSQGGLGQLFSHVDMESEIKSLKNREQTLLGERGVNFSGGQKSRLALARALYRNPELLLLDDTFAAVDSEKEQVIFENLFREYSSLTILMTTHRFAALPLFDAIVVLSKGKMVGIGDHKTLIETSPVYQSLWHKKEVSSEPRGLEF